MTVWRQVRIIVQLSIFLVGGGDCSGRLANDSEKRNLLAAEDLNKLLPESKDVAYDATVAFLSDDSLLVQLCNPPATNCRQG